MRRRDIPESMRREIFDLDGGVCAYCGELATAIDHVRPFSKGGATERSNLVAACQPCNSAKSGKLDLVMMARGFFVIAMRRDRECQAERTA